MFVSAQLPVDAHGELTGATAAEQAGRALENLAHQLRSTGLSLEDVVSLEIHLVDPADGRPSTPRSRLASSPRIPPSRSPVYHGCPAVRGCRWPPSRNATESRRVPRNDKPPSPRTISGFLYIAVLIIAVALAYVAVRALLA